jgi:hypothetical protein
MAMALLKSWNVGLIDFKTPGSFRAAWQKLIGLAWCRRGLPLDDDHRRHR